MQSKDVGSRDATSSGTTRRRFLGSSLAGGAALLAGKWSSVLQARVSPAQDDAVWIEASIQQLQALMASGELTSRELTRGYIHRIGSLNPLLGAVIQINPEAGATAARRDNERRSGHIRGPLHGIPILLKDNIATADTMQTTAGSLALVNSRVPADAPIVERLRAAGAVILGKANLSEWANFRGFAPFNGWSARGSFTRCPYLLDFDPCGSSSGSGVAPAANLCAGAVGTETDGSIVCPAGNNLVVGLKPTLGVLSQDGIIPIGHSQDTAGPMARTVRDVAIMLSVMQTPFGPALGHALPSDYTTFLQRGALSGARIGVDERYFTPDYGGEPDLIAVVQKGFDAMEALGATLVPTDSGDPFAYFDAEFTVLLVEFKVHIAEYLATLDHTSMRTLADLIAFNIAHCPNEMRILRPGAVRDLGVDERGSQRSGLPRGPCPLSAVGGRGRHRRRNGAGRPRCDRGAHLQLCVLTCRRRWVPKHLRSHRLDARRKTGGHLDVQRVPPRAGALGVCVRPGTRDPAAEPARVPRLGS